MSVGVKPPASRQYTSRLVAAPASERSIGGGTGLRTRPRASTLNMPIDVPAPEKAEPLP